jgi:DNA-directed RNA polymerase specialized sigma24 family protein
MRAALRMKCGGSDLAQMTLLEAQAVFPTLRGYTPEELAAWLWSILRHNQLNLYRQYFESQKRQVGLEISLDDRRLVSRLQARLCIKNAPADESAQREE